MANAFEILGVPQTADDATIRKRYLELTVAFPPEQNPEKAATLRAAYDKIATLPKRASYWLYEMYKEDSLEEALEEVACLIPTPRPTLQQLLEAAYPKS